MTPAERRAALRDKAVQRWVLNRDGGMHLIDAALTVALEEAAKVAQSRYMGDNNREDMEARRIAAAIRALIPGSSK